LQVKLAFNVIDLWSTTIAENDFSLEALLSHDEMRRALLFHSDREAAMFVARRGIMRLILATYTGILPADIKFAYNQFGKPALESRVHDVRFSVSQSGDLAI
jgi:4'-phosphopantetheinyl transferase